MGTPEYCAPEIVYSKPSEPNQPYTIAVDIFSLGAVIYYILYGKSLFRYPITFHQYVWGNGKLPDESDEGMVDEKHQGQRRFWQRLLAIDPSERPNTGQCLEHRWLNEFKDQIEDKHSDGGDLHLENHAYLLGRHQNSIKCLASFQKRNLLASGGEDFFIKIWDTKKRTLLHSMDNSADGVPLALAFSPDASFLASTNGYQVRFWDAEFGICRHTVLTFTNPIRGISLLTSEKLLYADTEGVHVRTIRTGLYADTGGVRVGAVGTGDHRTLHECCLIEAMVSSEDGILSVVKDINGIIILLQHEPDGSFKSTTTGKLVTHDPFFPKNSDMTREPVASGDYRGRLGPTGGVAVSLRGDFAAAIQGSQIEVWDLKQHSTPSTALTEKARDHGCSVALGETSDDIAYVNNDGDMKIPPNKGVIGFRAASEFNFRPFEFTCVAYTQCGKADSLSRPGVAAGTDNGAVFLYHLESAKKDAVPGHPLHRLLANDLWSIDNRPVH